MSQVPLATSDGIIVPGLIEAGIRELRQQFVPLLTRDMPKLGAIIGDEGNWTGVHSGDEMPKNQVP
jgi:hypothetical protein